jgi:leucyl/phenylalanyl-tRNA---protein transferase
MKLVSRFVFFTSCEFSTRNNFKLETLNSKLLLPIFVIEDDISFPPVHLAEPDGLLAIGGDLSSKRLLDAYKKGIFPWYEGEYILWWSPDPRFVLFPEELKISHSMKQLLKQNVFRFSINEAFDKVIHQCRIAKRSNQHGTWITDAVEKAYTKMHQLGYAHSAEAWQGSELVGGLYGIRIGKVFFGESMFSTVSNASKFAFINLMKQLKTEGVELIDCQVYTPHLESLGARMIPRSEFIQLLNSLTQV